MHGCFTRLVQRGACSVQTVHLKYLLFNMDAVDKPFYLSWNGYKWSILWGNGASLMQLLKKLRLVLNQYPRLKFELALNTFNMFGGVSAEQDKTSLFWWKVLTIHLGSKTWLDPSNKQTKFLIPNAILHTDNFVFLQATSARLLFYYTGGQKWGGLALIYIFFIISTTTGTRGIHHDPTTPTSCMYLSASNKWQQFSVFIWWPLDHVLFVGHSRWALIQVDFWSEHTDELCCWQHGAGTRAAHTQHDCRPEREEEESHKKFLSGFYFI